ncbi:MAG: hypothetical protein R3C01_16670 [Planctomycetaceae bacterium]
MSSAVLPQAIAGVSAGKETPIDVVYPSICASWLGRLIGTICHSIPVKVGGVKLSCLLFGLPLAPLALVGYVMSKLTWERYELTNRGIGIWKALGNARLQQISLTDFADIAINVQPGMEFFHAGDLQLQSAKGDVLMTLAGVPHPDRFRQQILEARAARQESDNALATIEARHK